MTGDEFTAKLEALYKSAADSIAALECPQMRKEEALARLRQQAMYRMISFERLLYRYDEQTNNYEKLHEASRLELTPEHYGRVAKLFDVNSPSLLVGRDVRFYIYSSGAYEEQAANGQATRLRTAHWLMADAAKGELGKIADEDSALLGDFWVKVLNAANDKALKTRERCASLIQPTPDVPLDKLFGAIVSPHKGKVVLVDFWNTWCGPCRNAIRRNEPLKSAELSSPDIVWIYIADESSPIGKYTEMIPEIKGLHYRLTSEQWKQLVTKDFPAIDGIPAYALADKDGKVELRLDFRDHDLMKKILLGELAK